jgi:ubiquinone/menaquinone biosynthesis C-methylase UbiE
MSSRIARKYRVVEAVRAPPPDIETSSADYAARFSGSAGAYLLEVQDASLSNLISSYANGTVIDVGGGHGQLLDLYSTFGMDVTVHGSDPTCFARLDPSTKLYHRVVSDICALPFEDRSFDVVVAVRLITHVSDWPAVLAEMCRVARFAVIIDYPSKRSLNALTPLLFNLKRGIEKNTRTYTLFTQKELKSVLNANGFPQVVEYKQFFFPMVIHRVFKGGWLLRVVENICRSIGLTRLLGSPVMLRAERTVERR